MTTTELNGQIFRHGTWLQEEAYAYPSGGQLRKGEAIFPDGKRRRVWAGIPDTFFSIPAHARIGNRYVTGWVGVDDSLVDCPNRTDTTPGIGGPFHPHGELHCEKCSFGLMESPTYGALVFHLSKHYQEAV